MARLYYKFSCRAQSHNPIQR